MPGPDHVGRVVIVADGDVEAVPLRRAVEPSAASEERAYVLAADGGALKAEAAGVFPDLVIGDGDSLTAADAERLRGHGTELRIVPSEKEESDTELCVREAIARDARSIDIFGALGGLRPEHTLANLALLALPGLSGRHVTVEHGPATVRLVGSADGPSRVEVHGHEGDFLSLQPIAERVEGVVTDGLLYPLRGEPLHLGPSRGLSNELISDLAVVTVERGRLLLTHTRRDELAVALPDSAGPGSAGAET
jgi:thiamine pyrophosphokinase